MGGKCFLEKRRVSVSLTARNTDRLLKFSKIPLRIMFFSESSFRPLDYVSFKSDFLRKWYN
jgi:hypothetical protein